MSWQNLTRIRHQWKSIKRRKKIFELTPQPHHLYNRSIMPKRIYTKEKKTYNFIVPSEIKITQSTRFVKLQSVCISFMLSCCIYMLISLYFLKSIHSRYCKFMLYKRLNRHKIHSNILLPIQRLTEKCKFSSSN